MFNKKRYLFVGTLALASLIAVPALYAQTTSGSVVGTLTDPSGAPIANTQVNLTNLGTGVKKSAPTNTQGLYQFINLPPGQYSVGVKKSGFKSFLRSPVTVQTETVTRINISMQVGELSQTVEVTAQTPLLQPQSSSLGEVISERQANTLPLNGRNPMNLVALVPSVVPQGGSMSNPNGQNPFAWGNYQIGGGMANQSTMWLDGAPVNANYDNLTALIPTQDSLAQFKVATSSLSPQYGRFAGGVVNFVTKSGTNKVHGTLWEYLRNRNLDANTFWNNAAGTPRGAFTQNQFGFNLGGPVYIPKIYNGKNKTFFFVDYEGFRLRQGVSYTETVPTAAERAGDLSGLAAAQGVNIYDPLTTCGTSTPEHACTPGVATGSRLQFAGNKIPTDRLNPTSQTFLKLYPMPNAPGNAKGVGNWVGNGSQGGNNNETVVHIDQNVSENQHISARYTYWGNINLPIDPMSNGVCKDRCTETFNTNNFVLGDTYTFTPTTIMEIHLSYQRFVYDRTPETLGYDLTTLGWPAALNSEVSFRDLPVPVINGFDTENTFGSNGAGSVIVSRNDNYRAAGSITKVMGNHTFKMGAEFLRMTDNYTQTNTPTGSFSFSPSLTAANALNTAGSGLGLATFLLGYPTGGGASTNNFVAGQQYYPAVYFDDSWHARSNLTFNLGVRWEHTGPWTERFNRMSFLDPIQTNQVLSAHGINVPGNIDLVNSKNDPYRSNVKPDWKQFSPRVGLAYQFANNMVFHAGYGIFWLPNDIAFSLSPNNDPVNSIGSPIQSGIYPGIPVANISDPYPQGIVIPPGRNPSYATDLLGTGPTESQLGNPYGYAQQWNADIQKQFGSGFLLDVAYGGAKGTHLPFYGPQMDQMPDQYLSLGNALFDNVANPFYPYITAPGSSLANATIQASQLLRPYPEYTGMSYAGQGIGNSTYESLQVKAQKRFSGGNTIMVAYTHAKLISDTGTLTGWLEGGGTGGAQDWNNLRAEKSLASFDVPDRLVVSYVLDVPVGKGRKYLSHANGFVNAVAGGWGIEGVTTFQSGFPLHLTNNSGNINSPGAGAQRPNVTSGCNVFTSGSATERLGEWFNTSCFTQPAAFTYGDEPRNDPHLRAPGIADFDFSVFKNFAILPEDRAHVQFRAEFFNLFNRVQFGFPGQAFGSSNFGQITTQSNSPRLVQFALRLAF